MNNVEKQEIGFLVFWVGQKCTLRCKNCSNLIPYSKQISYDSTKCLQDLNKLMQTANVGHMQIQGGEPFTHKDIDIFINEIGKTNIPLLEIATNGTVLLNEKTITALKNNPNIKIRISNYDCCEKQRDKFISQLNENSIPFQMYDYMYGNGMWFDSGGPDTEKIVDDFLVEELYKNCDNKICHTLADGILTICGKIPILKELHNHYLIKKNDEVDIRNTNDINVLKADIINFKNNYFNYREHCRYCKGTRGKIPAALQIG